MERRGNIRVTGRLREAREIKRKARVRECRAVPSRSNRLGIILKSQVRVEVARLDITECARRYHTVHK